MLETHPAPFDDLESLWDFADSGRQPRAARDEPQEQGLLLVCEGSECLPQPLDELILLIHPISVPIHTGKYIN